MEKEQYLLYRVIHVHLLVAKLFKIPPNDKKNMWSITVEHKETEMASEF